MFIREEREREGGGGEGGGGERERERERERKIGIVDMRQIPFCSLNVHVVMTNFPLMKFLELLQDYCLHICFSGYQDSKTSLHGVISHRDNTHLMLRPPSHLEESHDMTSCKLYHSHSVVSAVLNAKQLVVSAGRRSAGGAVPTNKPTGVTLNKEDNSGTRSAKLTVSYYNETLKYKTLCVEQSSKLCAP